jgi:hypothetical protein
LATVPRWTAIPMVLAGGAVALPTGRFFGIAVAEGVALTVFMILFSLMLWWPLPRYSIAWMVTASVVAVHLLLVLQSGGPRSNNQTKP